MIRIDLLLTFESCLEEPPEPGTLKGDELCSDLDGWNSLAVLALISVINKEYGITLPPAGILACQKVDDVIDLVLAQVPAGPGMSQR
jgi:acyl carrier protein